MKDLAGQAGLKFGSPASSAPGAANGQAKPGGAPAADLTPIQQLERLAQLRDAGVLTSEEFDAKKAEILKRI